MPARIHSMFTHDIITVTDLPNMGGANQINGYNYLPADAKALQDYRNAGVGLLHADTQLEFWQRLGHAVALAKVARCHGCAAYAARVIKERDFHNRYGRSIWICGRGDHYFLVLTDQPQAAGANNLTPAAFRPQDIVVDLWFYNVTRQTTGRLELATMAMMVQNFAFITGQNDIRTFVEFAAPG